MGFLKRLLGISDQPEFEIKIEPVSTHEDRTPPTDLGDLRGQLPDSVITLYAGVGGIDVVGESHYRDAIDRVVRGPYEGGVQATYWAQLVREPDNPYDPYAVAVRISGEKCGHLSKGDARAYGPVLDRLVAAGRQVAVRCDVRHGWNRPGEERGNYSLRVYMDTPERQADLLAKEGIVTTRTEPPEQKSASRPEAVPSRVTWRRSQSGRMDYEGLIGDVLVAEIEKAYDPERWIWHIRVPINGPDRGWPPRLKDAKAEVERVLADWQP